MGTRDNRATSNHDRTLSRRRFLTLAAIGASGAAATLVGACQQPSSGGPAIPGGQTQPTASAASPAAKPAAPSASPSAPAAAATTAPAQASSGRPLTPTFYSWITDIHPAVKTVTDDYSKKTPVNLQIAPVQGFGIDRFVAEARDQNSTWDVYVGMTPFVEMTQLVAAGVIEPWDNYMPKDVLDDILPAIREECSLNGKLYTWPFLLDVTGMGVNTELTSKAGASDQPTTWDEYLENGKKVIDSKAAPYGVTFDAHGWRSLAPFTYSLSTQVFKDNLFQFTSDPAIQALELMKKMKDLSGPDVLNPGNTDNGVNDTPDENQFTTRKVAYFTKYQNAPIRSAANWPDPSKLKLGPLPKFASGEGGSVFWDTGVALFKYGKNKEQAAEYLKALTYDERIWQESIGGGRAATGHLPPYNSVWTKWQGSKPSWMQDYALQVFTQLKVSKPISNHKFGLTQFVIGQPIWEKYLKGENNDPKAVMQQVQDAVDAEIKKTG